MLNTVNDLFTLLFCSEVSSVRLVIIASNKFYPSEAQTGE